LCRDYGEYDLSLLLPEDYNIPGGTWILYSTNPQGLDIVISDYGLIFVSEEITPGIYVFHYKLECIYIEVNVKILEDINCVKDCEGGEISTALTPNGDRVNDTFYAGVDPGGSCTVDVQIFNRWGAKVFEAQNYQNDWSGTVNSNAIGSAGKITTGTYYYILRYKTDGEVEQTLTGYFYVATE
jgi:gliding motility-associated-like protein